MKKRHDAIPHHPSTTGDLFAAITPQKNDEPSRLMLSEGAYLLRRFAHDESAVLLSAVTELAHQAPWRRVYTPGGRPFSVTMTNCGPLGWVSDRHGYRYSANDPETNHAWPAMPDCFLSLAQRAASEAGYPGFQPDACLINRYEAGARMGLHQDRDEADFSAPIVSVSLGMSAQFLWGNAEARRSEQKVMLHHGDVVVFGGASRLCFHGIAPLAAAPHPDTGALRYNLTFRRAR